MESLIPITLFLSTAAVLILRPVTKRLGLLLETLARERQRPPADNDEIARLRTLVEHTAKRVERMEERLDFTETLLSGSRRPAVSAATMDPPIGNAFSPGTARPVQSSR